MQPVLMGPQLEPHENLATVIMHKTDCIILFTVINKYTLSTHACLYLDHISPVIFGSRSST